MDHLYELPVAGLFSKGPNTYYRGRRPTGIYIPRFRNATEAGDGFGRGYDYQASSREWAGAARRWRCRASAPVSRSAHARSGFGEMLPTFDIRVTLAAQKDKWGLPVVHVICEIGDNERNMAKQIIEDGKATLQTAEAVIMSTSDQPGVPGLGIHEMGTARMGKDPTASVLNEFNQAHDVKNLFVTDGAAMASSGCVNPSLTYMALSARAAHHAVEFLKEGKV